MSFLPLSDAVLLSSFLHHDHHHRRRQHCAPSVPLQQLQEIYKRNVQLGSMQRVNLLSLARHYFKQWERRAQEGTDQPRRGRRTDIEIFSASRQQQRFLSLVRDVTVLRDVVSAQTAMVQATTQSRAAEAQRRVQQAYAVVSTAEANARFQIAAQQLEFRIEGIVLPYLLFCHKAATSDAFVRRRRIPRFLQRELCWREFYNGTRLIENSEDVARHVHINRAIVAARPFAQLCAVESQTRRSHFESLQVEVRLGSISFPFLTGCEERERHFSIVTSEHSQRLCCLEQHYLTAFQEPQQRGLIEAHQRHHLQSHIVGTLWLQCCVIPHHLQFGHFIKLQYLQFHVDTAIEVLQHQACVAGREVIAQEWSSSALSIVTRHRAAVIIDREEYERCKTMALEDLAFGAEIMSPFTTQRVSLHQLVARVELEASEGEIFATQMRPLFTEFVAKVHVLELQQTEEVELFVRVTEIVLSEECERQQFFLQHECEMAGLMLRQREADEFSLNTLWLIRLTSQQRRFADDVRRLHEHEARERTSAVASVEDTQREDLVRLARRNRAQLLMRMKRQLLERLHDERLRNLVEREEEERGTVTAHALYITLHLLFTDVQTREAYQRAVIERSSKLSVEGVSRFSHRKESQLLYASREARLGQEQTDLEALYEALLRDNMAATRADLRLTFLEFVAFPISAANLIINAEQVEFAQLIRLPSIVSERLVCWNHLFYSKELANVEATAVATLDLCVAQREAVERRELIYAALVAEPEGILRRQNVSGEENCSRMYLYESFGRGAIELCEKSTSTKDLFASREARLGQEQTDLEALYEALLRDNMAATRADLRLAFLDFVAFPISAANLIINAEQVEFAQLIRLPSMVSERLVCWNHLFYSKELANVEATAVVTLDLCVAQREAVERRELIYAALVAEPEGILRRQNVSAEENCSRMYLYESFGRVAIELCEKSTSTKDLFVDGFSTLLLHQHHHTIQNKEALKRASLCVEGWITDTSRSFTELLPFRQRAEALFSLHCTEFVDEAHGRLELQQRALVEFCLEDVCPRHAVAVVERGVFVEEAANRERMYATARSELLGLEAQSKGMRRREGLVADYFTELHHLRLLEASEFEQLLVACHRDVCRALLRTHARVAAHECSSLRFLREQEFLTVSATQHAVVYSHTHLVPLYNRVFNSMCVFSEQQCRQLLAGGIEVAAREEVERAVVQRQLMFEYDSLLVAAFEEREEIERFLELRDEMDRKEEKKEKTRCEDEEQQQQHQQQQQQHQHQQQQQQQQQRQQHQLQKQHQNEDTKGQEEGTAAKRQISETTTPRYTQQAEAQIEQQQQEALLRSQSTSSSFSSYWGLFLADALQQKDSSSESEQRYYAVRVTRAAAPAFPTVRSGDMIIAIDGEPVFSLAQARRKLLLTTTTSSSSFSSSSYFSSFSSPLSPSSSVAVGRGKRRGSTTDAAAAAVSSFRPLQLSLLRYDYKVHGLESKEVTIIPTVKRSANAPNSRRISLSSPITPITPKKEDMVF